MSGERFPHLHLLVAEDDALIAIDLEQAAAARFGFRTSVVHTLSAAQDRFVADPPHIAILDVNLGGESTAALAERLVERCIPFLIVSGYRSHRLERLAGGLALEKPFAIEDLEAMIARALARLG